MCIDSTLWGKNCASYKVESWEVFPKYLRNGLEYSDQTLLANRYYGGQEFMTFRYFRIQVWRGKGVKFTASY